MADEERVGIPQSKLDELAASQRCKHVVGDGGDWEVVLGVPKGPDAKMYKHQLHDPATRADAQEVLFRKVVLCAWTQWDGVCDVAALLKQFPLAPEGCSDALGALAGLKATERAKT